MKLIGASLSEPHIDELNVRNLYIIIIYIIYMVRPSPARRHIHCTATRDIFRRPHEETSAFSVTTCIIIAESAKQIALVRRIDQSLSHAVSRKAKWLQTLCEGCGHARLDSDRVSKTDTLSLLPLVRACLAR